MASLFDWAMGQGMGQGYSREVLIVTDDRENGACHYMIEARADRVLFTRVECIDSYLLSRSQFGAGISPGIMEKS
jgi:hypothetical protein